MKMKMMEAAAILAVLIVLAPCCVCQDDKPLLVPMTLVRNASALDAFCLDGSLPAYHMHKGFGAGARNWLLQFEGGGWCDDVATCLERAQTRRGSTRYMNKLAVFSGILGNNASLNPDFYNWNRVKLRYCDGGSFAGDSKFINGSEVLYFKGQKIWEAVIQDLLPKGLGHAHKALLSGCSAGGLASFLHCEGFTNMLPSNTTVKCLSDAGFFMDVGDINKKHRMRAFYQNLISLQGIEKNLNENCTSSLEIPSLCIFPQYALKYIDTPFFILNTAYDVFQFHHGLAPPSADAVGNWKHCTQDVTTCNTSQLDILQSFRHEMMTALYSFFKHSRRGGMFLNSCFAHCQSELQDTWFADSSPRVHNKTIAEAVGDWYFSRSISKEIDCPYPCDKTCHNLITA